MSVLLNLLSGFTGATVTFVTSGTSSAATITIPASAQENDLAIIYDVAFNNVGVTPSSATPSGFTLLNSVTSTEVSTITRNNVSWKKLLSTDPGTLVAGMNDVQEWKTILIFRCDTSYTPSFSTINSQGSGGAAPTNQTVTASGGTTPLVVVGASSVANTLSASPSFASIVSSGGSNSRLGYLIYNQSPGNVVVSATDGGFPNALQSFYVSFT